MAADETPAETDDQFRCICPAPPVAVEGCPAHRFRYAAQQWLIAHPDDEEATDGR